MNVRTWLLSACVLGALPAAAAEPTAGEVADRLQAMYEGARDFKAAFRQRYRSAALGEERVSTGFVYVKKPGLMRWDYVEPRPKHFVVDGKALYVYDPDLEQVVVERDFAASELSTAITFLWGKGKLREEFDVTFSSRADLASADRWVLQLVPRKKASFRKLFFAVERGSYRVLETLLEDPGGNANRIAFSKIALNAGLDEAAFRFIIPEGVEVIEAPKR